MLGNRLLITVLLGSVAATSGWSQRASHGTAWNQRPSSKIEAERSRAGKQQALANYGQLPLSFEANQGQTDDQVKFLSRGPGFSLFLTAAEAVLDLSNPLEEENLVTLPEEVAYHCGQLRLGEVCLRVSRRGLGVLRQSWSAGA